jgi:hypothetical protein
MMRRLVSSIGVAVGSLFATALPAAAQAAQGYPPPPTVQPTVIQQAPPAVAPAAEAAQAAAPLAFTGVEIGILVLAVALLVTLGTLALIAGRRRAVQVA